MRTPWSCLLYVARVEIALESRIRLREIVTEAEGATDHPGAELCPKDLGKRSNRVQVFLQAVESR